MPPPPIDTPVPFVDDTARPVQDAFGRPMLRPAGLDPHLFVNQGTADKRLYDALLKYGGGAEDGGGGAGLAILQNEIAQLSNFRQGHAWDAQRIGGHFHAEFIDYATVAIGLYAASSGMARGEILGIQDSYAAVHSHYAAGTPMDRTYTHLPARNVANTETGYRLIETGRIRATAP